MTVENGSCNKHSGICAEITHLMDSDSKQWTVIDGIKTTLTKMLTAVIITLLVALVNLITMLAKLN